MSVKLIKAVILGGPGSGKGTISARIFRDFAFKHLSSGDILRSHIAKETGVKAKKFVEAGGLVPDEIVTQLLADEIASLKDISWLLDGFPRTEGQAKALQRVASLDLAINLNVPADVIVERIRGRWTHLPSGRIYHTEFNPPQKEGFDDVTGEQLVQRDDDKPEVVLKRLEAYAANVEPVLDYYRSLKILQEFHGKKSNEIWPRIHSFLSRYVQPMSGPF